MIVHSTKREDAHRPVGVLAMDAVTSKQRPLRSWSFDESVQQVQDLILYDAH